MIGNKGMVKLSLLTDIKSGTSMLRMIILHGSTCLITRTQSLHSIQQVILHLMPL